MHTGVRQFFSGTRETILGAAPCAWPRTAQTLSAELSGDDVIHSETPPVTAQGHFHTWSWYIYFHMWTFPRAAPNQVKQGLEGWAIC